MTENNGITSESDEQPPLSYTMDHKQQQRQNKQRRHSTSNKANTQSCVVFLV